jgi:sporulation protein YlmC with PRC-barrel domain
MLRLYSQLIGRPIRVKELKTTLARAMDLAMDPDRGTLAALHTTRREVIAPVDIRAYEDDIWWIKDTDAFIEEESLIRLQSIPKKRRHLWGKRVESRDGDYLGRVADFVVEMGTLSLVQLYVKKKFAFFWVLEKRIIQFKEIVEIKDDVIIVKNNLLTDPERLQDFFRLQAQIEAPAPLASMDK